MSRLITAALTAVFLLFANGALADSQEDRLREVLPEIQSAIMQQGLVKTLRAYNAARADMTQADIDVLETTWKAELGSGNQPLITGTVRNVTALRMRKVIRETGRVVSAINVVDARGLSIAQTSTLPCVWLGTTGNVTNIAAADPNMVLIGNVDSKGSARLSQFEAFFPVADPDTGELIGAVVLIVDAESL